MASIHFRSCRRRGTCSSVQRPALAEAKARGWGVIVKEALANGRLTDRADGEHLTALGKEAAARGTTIDALALAAALSQPWADVVLSGAVTPDSSKAM